jgi:hypothetical protein
LFHEEDSPVAGSSPGTTRTHKRPSARLQPKPTKADVTAETPAQSRSTPTIQLDALLNEINSADGPEGVPAKRLTVLADRSAGKVVAASALAPRRISVPREPAHSS